MPEGAEQGKEAGNQNQQANDSDTSFGLHIGLGLNRLNIF